MPSSFSWVKHKNGDVAISHFGKLATTLRGQQAERFLADISSSNEQDLMARVTGNYKRGNERRARQHPRNR